MTRRLTDLDGLTDSSLADRFISYGVTPVFVDGLGFLRWDGRRWEEISDTEMGGLIQFWCSDLVHDNVDQVPPQLIPKLVNVMNTVKQESILQAYRKAARRRVQDFDADPGILNTPSGIVSLRTGETSPHDPARYCTRVTSGSYRPGYTHPDWDAALGAVDPEVQTWLQSHLGQGITGHPSRDAVPILQGGGANGKSVLSTGGVLPAVGDYGVQVSSKIFGAGSENLRLPLRGARLAFVEELTDKRVIDVGALKELVDTPNVIAKKLYKDILTFPASHSIIATTNYLPSVSETDHGTWRRMALIPFTKRFRAANEAMELPDDVAGDAELPWRLGRGKEGQHDAIVTWLVEGAMRWYANGNRRCEVPVSVQEYNAEWRGDADPIMRFWAECLVVGAPDKGVPSYVLIEAFNLMLKKGGQMPWTVGTFSGRFGGHERTVMNRVRKVRTATRFMVQELDWQGVPTWRESKSQERVWLGVRLREMTDEALDALDRQDPSSETFPRSIPGKLLESHPGGPVRPADTVSNELEHAELPLWEV